MCPRRAGHAATSRRVVYGTVVGIRCMRGPLGSVERPLQPGWRGDRELTTCGSVSLLARTHLESQVQLAESESSKGGGQSTHQLNWAATCH